MTIQLCRFPNQGGQLIKDANFFIWTQSEWNNHLLVPITVEDEVSFTIKDSLIATINHSGTLNRRHYWAIIKDLHSSSWYSCNGELVSNVEERSLNNTVSYILFLQKSLNVPQDLPKKVFFARGFLSLQTLSLGVTTPHITPDILRELSLLTQFSGFTTLQSKVSEKHCKGARSSMILSMRSDNNLTYNPSPSNS